MHRWPAAAIDRAGPDEIPFSQEGWHHRGRSVSYFAAFIMVISAGFASPVRISAANADSDLRGTMMQFDMPAQPLAAALESFMAVAKVAVIVDSAEISGRNSAALKGSFLPDGALRLLLAGTGLDPRPIGSGAYTLVLSARSTAARPPQRFVKYAAAIQQAVVTALCGRDETRPMRYRMVMRMWLSASGTATRVELSSTTGSPNLDAAIGDALKHIDIGAPTPSGLPQPVKLAITPNVASDAACSSGDGAGSLPVPDVAR